MRDRTLVLAAVAAWLTVAIAWLVIDLPLKHDEAQYAVAARGDASWLYLSAGTVALARASLALGVGPRLVCVLAGAGVIVAAYALGRVAFGSRTGAYAACVIAGAHPFTIHAGDLIADLPAAACAVAGIAIVVRELERERGPSWWLVACAAAFAAAFYLRYGHAPLVAIVAVAALVEYPRVVLARWRVVAVTCAAFAALLVPHVVVAIRETGSPLGILTFSAGVPARSYVGEGLVAYVTGNPFSLFGALGAPLAIAGLAGVVASRRARFLVAIAIVQIVVLGLQTRAQPRYLYVATILLVTCGIDVVRRASPPPQVRRGALGLVALAWLGCVIAICPGAQRRAREREPLARAAAQIRSDDAGRPCAISATQIPQLVWATHCTGVLPGAPWPDRARRYIVGDDGAWRLSP